MTYSEIITAFENAASNVNSTGFFLNAAGNSITAQKAKLSISYEEAYPQIAVLFVKYKPDYTLNNANYECIIAFYGKDNIDAPADENDQNGNITPTEDVVDSMFVLMDLFMNYVLNHNSCQFENVTATPEIKILANTVSGCMVQFTLKSKLNC